MFYGMNEEKNRGSTRLKTSFCRRRVLLLLTLIKIDVRPFHFDQIEKSIHLFVWSEIKSQTKFLLMKWKPFICPWKGMKTMLFAFLEGSVLSVNNSFSSWIHWHLINALSILLYFALNRVFKSLYENIELHSSSDNKSVALVELERRRYSHCSRHDLIIVILLFTVNKFQFEIIKRLFSTKVWFF